MPLVRMLISSRPTLASPIKDAVENTVYFNVSGSIDPPDYQALVNDLWQGWGALYFAKGRYLDIRAYNMDDAKPRPVKAFKRDLAPGVATTTGVPQVALCLSYFADRNLPRQRGRIFLGPWPTTNDRPNDGIMDYAMAAVDVLTGLGGLNVDWSLYSPTLDTHTRISHVWVDNAWDIIRSRRLPGTSRKQRDVNG